MAGTCRIHLICYMLGCQKFLIIVNDQLNF